MGSIHNTLRVQEQRQKVAQEKAIAASESYQKYESKGLIDPKRAVSNPRQVAGEITRANYKLYEDNFLPVEEDLIRRISDRNAAENEAEEAGTLAAQGVDRGQKSFERNLSRSGIQLTQRQKNSLSRRNAISKTTTVATAENNARRSIRDRNDQLASDVSGIGRNVAASADTNIGTASTLAAQRESANESIREQRKASKKGGAAAGAAYGAQYGPWGAVAGGAIGYVLG